MPHSFVFEQNIVPPTNMQNGISTKNLDQEVLLCLDPIFETVGHSIFFESITRRSHRFKETYEILVRF